VGASPTRRPLQPEATGETRNPQSDDQAPPREGVFPNLWPSRTVDEIPTVIDGMPPKVRFAPDSSLEEAGFELSVPPAGAGLFRG
jgi:hypothetical protein